MNSFVDSQYLRSAGRAVEVPFHIRINCDGRTHELLCMDVLRILPGKRLVCLGEWNSREVVVKFFLNPRSATRHCSREAKGVMALEAAGIKTPELLFRGRLSSDDSPVLGFQRIIHSQNLAEAWETITDDAQRIALLSRAVAVIADQHEAGIRQEDLHPGNFLITEKDIYAIDGDAVDTHLIGEPLPRLKSLRNIALFFAQFQPKYDKLAPEVFHEYAKKRAWQDGDELSARLIKEIRSKRNVRKKDYLKKIYRESTAFVCRQSWRQHMVCDRNFYSKAIVDFLADPNFFVDSGRLLKEGNSSTVSLV